MERKCICEYEEDRWTGERVHSEECDAYNGGREAGMKKVVEWVETNWHVSATEADRTPAEQLWQAKKKEWGIE